VLTRRTLAVLAFAALVGMAERAESQTLTELIQAGRFEEAVALAPNASPEESAQIARQIFNQAYTFGHQ
jgi:hypothetical protein